MSQTFEEQLESLKSLNIFISLNEYDEARCKEIKEFTESQSSVEGDIAQCGVFFGLTAYFMAKNFNGDVHLFDSWKGLPALSDKDTDAYHEGMYYAPYIESAYMTLKEFNNVKTYIGWIPETLELVSSIKFSMVHLDLDLYKSTLDSLKFFWDRMSPGGLIVCDHHKEYATGVIAAVEEFFGHTNFPSSECGQMLIYKPVD